MKEAIVDKATELFLQLGFKSVTMDDISAAMSISKKTLYENFDNKEMLVEVCARKRLVEVIQSIITIIEETENPIQQLYQIKKEVLKHLSNEKTSPQYQLQKYYPCFYTELKEKEFEMLGNIFKKSLQKGIEMKLFRSDINLDFVTRIYFNGIRGIRNINLFPLELYKIDDLMSAFFDYHLRAISTSKGLEVLATIKDKINL